MGKCEAFSASQHTEYANDRGFSEFFSEISYMHQFLAIARTSVCRL